MLQLAIFGSRHQTRHLEKLTELLHKLIAAPDVELWMEERFYSYICELIELRPDDFVIFKRLEARPHLALSIGGDGTFLRVAKAMGQHSAPILGINSGHLGFLASANIDDDIDTLIATILSGRYRVEERTALRVTSTDPELSKPRYALNEVALLRRDTASMIDIDAHIGLSPLATYRGDGLIVSTPTGSTGYNLSVGGPIVVPGSPCFIISPIAVHSLSMRPIVIPDNATVTLHSSGRASTLLLNLDGKALVLPIDTVITISKAPFAIRVALLPGCDFITTLRTKMLWGTTNE